MNIKNFCSGIVFLRLGLWISCCLLCVTLLHAQSRVGIGTTTPHASALLDVSGINGGLLVPRMTEAQRNAINSPTAGLIVHQIFPESELLYFNGFQWVPTGSLKKISQAGRTGWRLIQGYDAFYGNIGSNAVDFSLSLSEASMNGATGTFSMAWGLNTTASEESSTSWGMSSKASGFGSTSWGNATEASGFFSTAFGEHNRAGASYRLAQRPW